MDVMEYDLSSFGTLLNAFRKRRHLTQQQLASGVGVHRSAIIRWEQGDFLPQSKAIVLELAQQLHLDDQETRELLEASLTELSLHWSVPLPRNPFFTGREEILETLRSLLSAEHIVAHPQSYALQGLGGIGKTQIALEYAYRYALNYRAVFWIAAETAETALSSLSQIAQLLQLPERQETDQQRMVGAVQRWLAAHSQWLLIWDNVEELSLLDRFLPSTRSGALLLTTRSSVLGTFARGIDLLPMQQEEGVLFVLRRARMLSPQGSSEDLRQLAGSIPEQYKAAEKLVATVGGLPLALDQAGAYLEETRCGLPTYLDLFRGRRAALLKLRGEGTRDHPASVTATFHLAMTATVGRHPAVRDLLRACALLEADAIPEELFCQGAQHLGEPLQAVCADELEWNRLLAVACSSSLVQRQPEARTLSMHRLVQGVLQEEMDEQENTELRRRLAHALDALFPEVTYDRWQQCERLLTHALLVAASISEQAEGQELAALLQKAADYLRQRAQYQQARAWYERALRIYERVLGPEHPQIAILLNRLAAIFEEQAEAEQAEPLYLRALRISEQALGPEHVELAYPLANLASFYFDQGKYSQAEPLYQRALHIFEQTLGAEHTMVAYPLNGLADLYVEQGHHDRAELFFERALRISETRGPVNPLVAQILDGLAKLYTRQGKDEQAQLLHERALRIQEQVAGPQHPHVAYPLLGLAIFAHKRSEYEQAESLYQRALAIREQALGDNHPLLMEPLLGLATLSLEQGDSVRAEALYQRALTICERRRRQNHPETAHLLYQLAVLRKLQGKLSEAQVLAAHALQIQEQIFHGTHPHTLAVRTLHAQLIQEQEGLQEHEPATESLPASDQPTLHRLSPDPLPPHVMSVAVRGTTEHMVHIRMVRMREVTFTCTVCGQTVTQLHYPSGQIKYCSEVCRAISAAQRQKIRVARQREKRRSAHEEQTVH